jgi:hypothetical protein
MPRPRRQYDDSDDEDDPFPRLPRRGGSQGRGDKRRKESRTTCLSRGFLVFINLAVLGLSLALVYLGASGLLRIDPSETQTGAERPFIFICVVGSLLAVSSLAGLFGAMCAISRDGGFSGACCSNRLLLLYYLSVLVECALLLYAAILCFVFVNKAAEYLAEYGDSILALAANEGLTLVSSPKP